MPSTDGMSRQRLTRYKLLSYITTNDKTIYNSGSRSTLILDLKSFIVEQLTQLSDNTFQQSDFLYSVVLGMQKHERGGAYHGTDYLQEVKYHANNVQTSAYFTKQIHTGSVKQDVSTFNIRCNANP